MDNENSGILPATEKQQYVIDLTEHMTREQAGRVIEVLKNGATPNNDTSPRPNQELPITDKQKAYIKDIFEQNGMDYDEEELNNMTRREASQLISRHAGRGGVEAPSQISCKKSIGIRVPVFSYRFSCRHTAE